MLSRVLALIALGSALASALRADVLVVDPAGGPGAALLQAALDAAQPGDIVLLREGDYSTATLAHLAGKGITITADTGHHVVLPGLDVVGVPAGQNCVLRGLEVQPQPAAVSAFRIRSLSASDPVLGCAWIEDCTAAGAIQTGTNPNAALGLSVIDHAVVVRCHLTGAPGLDAAESANGLATPGGHGLGVSFGLCIVHDTVATGGAGGDGPLLASNIFGGGAGFSGIFLEASIMGGTFTGGDEGTDHSPQTMPGPGISLNFADGDIRDVLAEAGSISDVGTPVAPMIGSGNFKTYPDRRRLLSLSSPVRELETTHVFVQGEPGDLAIVLISSAPGAALQPAHQGAFVLSSDVVPLSFVLGTIVNQDGKLEADVQMPRLPPGVDGLVLFTQLGAVTDDAQVLLGSGSALVWLSRTL